MTEFTKTKMHFALALLGTLFAVHTFFEKNQFEEAGFNYEYWPNHVLELKVFYVLALLGGLLALTVYCYAVALVSERSSWMERIGNYAYGLAIIVAPLYGGLYLSSKIAEGLERRDWAWAVRVTPVLPLILGVLWFVASLVSAWLLRNRLGDQDRATKVGQLAEQEIVGLNRAQELFAGQHYDLSVIEAWKAIEARLRRVLLLRRMGAADANPQALLRKAAYAGLVHEPAQRLIAELSRQRNVAISTEPVAREDAAKALQAARDILSTIALHDPHAAKPAR
jgi:MFS family permease